MGVCLINNAKFDSADFYQYQLRTIAFIDSFNSANHLFTLYFSDVESNALVLEFTKFKFSSPARMASGPIVTALGFATLVTTLVTPVGVILFFWYIPKNESEVIVYYSEDINPKRRKKKHTIVTNHEFKKLAIQKSRHLEAYERFLKRMTKEMLQEIQSGKTEVFSNAFEMGYD